VVNVVITGGAGFLGARLARELLAAGALDVVGGGARPLSQLTLIDRVPLPADLAADGRVAGVRSDLGEPAGLTGAGRDAVTGADVIFHLAAAVSGESEPDVNLVMRTNLHATETLLALCRAAGTNPFIVFSSSAAVFGDSADHPLPPAVDDQTLPNPQTSYGVQKLIGEHFIELRKCRDVLPDQILLVHDCKSTRVAHDLRFIKDRGRADIPSRKNTWSCCSRS